MAVAAGVCLTGCAWLGPVVDAPESDYFDGREFHYYGEKTQEYIPEIVLNYVLQLGEYWVHTPDRFGTPALPARVDEGELFVTWVNHATMLIQMDGYNILTDPVWSECVGPGRPFAACRHHEPGIPFDELPDIDAVIVSHAHYDHLDLPTLRQLHDEHDPWFVTTIGNGELIERAGSTRIIELEWWEKSDVLDGLDIVSVPARHWSRRGLFDTNRRLWMGAVVQSADSTAYFAGDTGYDEGLFQELRERFSPIDLAILPIGDYRPRWLANGRHMSPEEAVQASQALKAGAGIGMHFYTFKLSYGDRLGPVHDLHRAMERSRLPRETFIAPKVGRTYRLS